MKHWFAATILLLAIGTGRGDLPSEQTAERPAERTEALVTNVHAVNWITVLLPGGEAKEVRYAWVEPPQIYPIPWNEHLIEEAARRNRQLVLGKTVLLESDSNVIDEGEPLLRLALLDNGLMVNFSLIEEGYAQASSDAPERFLRLQREAQTERHGLWGRCDPAYPEVCIVSPPPDVDCEDLPFNTFPVLPPDPHQLSEGDGFGCRMLPVN